jgi:hypothetical protein
MFGTRPSRRSRLNETAGTWVFVVCAWLRVAWGYFPAMYEIGGGVEAKLSDYRSLAKSKSLENPRHRSARLMSKVSFPVILILTGLACPYRCDFPDDGIVKNA